MALWTVDSSNLRGIEYHAAEKALDVHFRNGAIWQYYPVEEAVYLEFRDAPSAGKYYAHYIKGNKEYYGRRIDEPAK